MVVPKHHSKAHSSTLPMKNKEKVKPTCFQRMLIIKHHGLMVRWHDKSAQLLCQFLVTYLFHEKWDATETELWIRHFRCSITFYYERLTFHYERLYNKICRLCHFYCTVVKIRLYELVHPDNFSNIYYINAVRLIKTTLSLFQGVLKMSCHDASSFIFNFK